MTPERWARLRTLFNEALERPWEERRAFVTEACGDDLKLREELLSLVEIDQAGLPITDMIACGIKTLETSPTLAAGELLLERFEIIRPLGSGGMGEVYEVVDRELQQTVALKIIRREIARNESVLARFKREVQLARRLSGPNICRIHELFVLRDKKGLVDGAFLTMECLEGITLADKLKGGPLNWREAHTIAMDVCAGLAAVHKAGIIHGDLKSRNIMIANRGGAQRAVLMDFGLAHELSEVGLTAETASAIPGGILGTPEYMAPEQFEGGAATPASDIYAVGIVLYELVTGKQPFASTNPFGVAVLRGKRLAPASSVMHEVPHRWDVAIRTCLEYEPIQRYQSADELARVLDGKPLRLCVSQKGWSGLIAAAAGSSLIGACTLVIPALLERVASEHHQKRVAVLPFDFAGNNQEASIVADGMMDSLVGELSNLAQGNETLWVVPASEIRRRKVNDPATALHEFGATMVVKGHFIWGTGTIRLHLELIDSRRMREVGYADIDNQDLSALQDDAAARLAGLMNGNPALVGKRVMKFLRVSTAFAMPCSIELLGRTIQIPSPCPV